MVFDRLDRNPGLRFIFTLAVLVILIQGLRLTQPIMLPIAFAAFLAMISLPVVFWLQKKRIPLQVAILLTVLAVVAVFGLLILLASQQFAELQARGPAYIVAIRGQVDEVLRLLEVRWPFLGETRASVMEFLVPENLLGLLDAQTLLAVAGGTFTRALSIVSTTFLVFLILYFALGEAAVLPRKLRAIAGRRMAYDERSGKIVSEVQKYLGIKTVTSLTTGVLLGVWTWLLGLDSPILLGLIAFVLNYVPTIGSVVASIPAVLLALVEFDPLGVSVVGFDFQRAFVTSLGYMAVNIVLGNWLEPIFVGRRLGLSTLVVVLSLVFWGWLWGAAGALLSVPLTMVVKIMLDNTRDLKWIAVLLDKNAPQEVLADSEEAS